MINIFTLKFQLVVWKHKWCVWVILNDIACSRILHFTGSGVLKLCHCADGLWLIEVLCALFVARASDYDIIKLWISLHPPTDLKESCYEILSFFAVDCCLHLKVFYSEDGGSRHLWNIAACVPDCTELHLMKTESSYCVYPHTRWTVFTACIFRQICLQNMLKFCAVIRLWIGNKLFLPSAKYGFHTCEKPQIPHEWRRFCEEQ